MRCFASLFAAVTFITAMLSSAASAQTDQPVVHQTSWGAIKAIYRGNTPLPYTTERVQETAAQIRKPTVTPMALNGSVYLAWPFATAKGEWAGWTGDKTSGGNIPNYCGDKRYTINSHTLGDNYARDLSRYDHNQAHQPIYASVGGYVLLAGIDGCYGYTVIIWDPTRHIEVRYSHLSSVNPWVGPNMSIRQGALIGYVGGTTCSGIENTTPHLHMVVYKNLVFPRIGQICSGASYACPFYFN